MKFHCQVVIFQLSLAVITPEPEAVKKSGEDRTRGVAFVARSLRRGPTLSASLSLSLSPPTIRAKSLELSHLCQISESLRRPPPRSSPSTPPPPPPWRRCCCVGSPGPTAAACLWPPPPPSPVERRSSAPRLPQSSYERTSSPAPFLLQLCFLCLTGAE